MSKRFVNFYVCIIYIHINTCFSKLQSRLNKMYSDKFCSKKSSIKWWFCFKINTLGIINKTITHGFPKNIDPYHRLLLTCVYRKMKHTLICYNYYMQTNKHYVIKSKMAYNSKSPHLQPKPAAPHSFTSVEKIRKCLDDMARIINEISNMTHYLKYRGCMVTEIEMYTQKLRKHGWFIVDVTNRMITGAVFGPKKDQMPYLLIPNIFEYQTHKLKLYKPPKSCVYFYGQKYVYVQIYNIMYIFFLFLFNILFINIYSNQNNKPAH